MYFLLHMITAVIAAVIIIYLSLACRLKKHNKSLHKWLSITMALCGITSLVGSIGLGLSFDIHHVTGFIALILSLIPFARYILKTSIWHHTIGDLAAIFAAISLVSGFINYGGLLLPAGIQCFTLEEVQADSRCLVIVDDVVYDMTTMPRWGEGQHFDYTCGGNYSKSNLPQSHQADKYYGPIIGGLCQ